MDRVSPGVLFSLSTTTGSGLKRVVADLRDNRGGGGVFNLLLSRWFLDVPTKRGNRSSGYCILALTTSFVGDISSQV